jgi:hypothetical protein
MKNDLARSITRSQTQSSSIRTKGKIIDAQYEISICRTTVDGPDPDTAQTGVDGLLIRPGFTKSQWLTCQ